ncbi:MAG: ATP-binding protein [Bacteroidales bacterium]|jgi:anti-sigma regulatory factor (Ser/Thr protein kinase)
MNFYSHKELWKILLLVVAVIIGIFSLLYTENLVKKLKAEERKKVELWAEATRQLINASDSSQNLVFLSSINEDNNTVPVILTDGNDSIISAKNFDPSKINDKKFLRGRLSKMKEKTKPIVIDFGDGYINRIYYRDSTILIKLIYYPYVQLSVIVLFILVSYVAFSSSRKAEQNQVWVGMSKETAHQLGTPTSSLAGWVEILQMKHPEIGIAEEMARDITRLEKVTERFSKIGSRPDLATEDIVKIIHQTIEYLKSRTSSKISFIFEPFAAGELLIPVNTALFSWVIENVCRNAVDATEGDGRISIKITETEEYAIVDLVDSGKGIPKSSHKKIFRPGFTTKERGWGLGLSLAKRIIEEYHSGKIFVRYSEPGKGTCFRIMMKKIVR